MIVNAYAVLDGFLVILRLVLGFAVVYIALSSWLSHRHAPDPHSRLQEERGSFLFLAASTLIGLSVISWPVLYLLLQSYVPAWEGVMCIYGVTQIGKGSIGPARFLPVLLDALQLLKPALVFAGGAWLVLHLLNGRTHSGPLAARVTLLLMVFGIVATADAGAELAYLVIPKKEEFAVGGCCTEVFDGASQTSRLLPMEWAGVGNRPWLYGLYFALNGATALALFGVLRYGWTGKSLVMMAIMVAFTIAFNAFFLVEAAAPLLLHLPYHHCPYDLLPIVPESMAAIGLFVLGTFGFGWGCLVGAMGRHPETVAHLPDMMRKLLKIGLFGWLGSLVMMSLELALAWAEQR